MCIFKQETSNKIMGGGGGGVTAIVLHFIT